MPGLIGLLSHGNAQFTGVRLGGVEQAKFDRGGILRVEGKVNAFFSECGAERIGLSAPDFRVSFHNGAALSPNLRTTFSRQTMFRSTAADTVWRVA
jgi:hypothetical protein